MASGDEIEVSEERDVQQAAPDAEDSFEQDMVSAMAASTEIDEQLQADEELLDRLIGDDGCRRRAIERDGRCQFRSLLVAMLHINPHSVTFNGCDGLRMEICEWLSEHRNEPTCDGGATWLEVVSAFLAERKKDTNDSPPDFAEYLRDMRDLSQLNITWGDEQTLGAFFSHFNNL